MQITLLWAIEPEEPLKLGVVALLDDDEDVLKVVVGGA